MGLILSRTVVTALADDPARSKHAPAAFRCLVDQNVYTGGEPENDDSFAFLAKANIKTIVSVDGMPPDLDAAKKHGLRYVHIPIGYDGIDQDAGRSLASLTANADPPYYIHCHHGQHRGPAAAAIVCRAGGWIDRDQAVDILTQAGTSQSYTGLWRDVEHFAPPTSTEPLPELVDRDTTSSPANAMARIGRRHANLSAQKEQGWVTPDRTGDDLSIEQALLMRQALDEFSRQFGEPLDPAFQSILGEAKAAARSLEDSFSNHQSPETKSRHFNALSQACRECHQSYRD